MSAYACSPLHGSEHKVGWHWAIELAMLGHDVWVLTRAERRDDIERAAYTPVADRRLRFVYHPLPKWMPGWLSRLSENRADYALWQWTAYRRAKALHATERFELVHHITWSAVRQPSFMGRLGIPFILGPLGGGERAPWPLRRGYGLRGHVLDALRDVSNRLIKVDPLVIDCFRRADKIYAKTPETKSVIPRAFQGKTECLIEIGVDGVAGDAGASRAVTAREGLRILFVGRFVYWKGMDLGLSAFATLVRSGAPATLTLVGGGPEEARWRRHASTLGVRDAVTWTPWVPFERMPAVYAASDVLLFPSLHDSSSNVVLEALAHGLPVLCLDLGGPGILVNDTCGRVVRTGGRTREQVVDDRAAALIALASDPACRSRLRQAAIARAGELTWNAHVRRAYSDVLGSDALSGASDASVR